MVTAETAVVLPVLVVVLAAAVWLLTCVAAQLRCVDAASSAARAAARGDRSVVAVVRALAPPGARLRITRGPGHVDVQVIAVVHPFGRLIHLAGMTVSGHAVADTEGDPAVVLQPP